MLIALRPSNEQTTGQSTDEIIINKYEWIYRIFPFTIHILCYETKEEGVVSVVCRYVMFVM